MPRSLSCLLSFSVVFVSSCNCGDGAAGPDAGTFDGGSAVDAGASEVRDASVAKDAGTDGGLQSGLDAAISSDAGRACMPRFLPLGDLDGGAFSSIANAVSRDGTTVVGQSESARGPEAMRWRLGTGMVALGGLTGSSFGSNAYDVSADGQLVVGVSRSGLVDCPGRADEAFRWTVADGMTALGDLPTGCFFSYAYGVSADGTTIVGGATNSQSNTAALWSSSSWRDLGFAMGDGNSSSIDAITPSLAVAVGTQRVGATAAYEAFRWQADAGEEVLGDLDGGEIYASAAAVSDDGSLVVGLGTSARGVEAFRWSRATGMTALGDFAGGDFSSQALAVSGDGAFIVGFGTTDAGAQAAQWTEASGITTLVSVLTSHGVTIPSGWQLTSATGVAVNGNQVTLTGNGTNPAAAPEAWAATYCLP